MDYLARWILSAIRKSRKKREIAGNIKSATNKRPDFSSGRLMSNGGNLQGYEVLVIKMISTAAHEKMHVSNTIADATITARVWS